MSKALMEKAFEKWWYLKYKDLMIEYDYIKDLGERKLKVNYWHSYCRQAFITGATWQREQLIAELREWVKLETADTSCDYWDMILADRILAKLDLLVMEQD
jgi:hypothetical protein